MKRITLAVLIVLGTSLAWADTQKEVVKGFKQSLPDSTVPLALQSAATAIGNGVAMNVTGLDTVRLTVNCASCSGGTTVNFEGTSDGATYKPQNAIQVPSGAVANSTSATGSTSWDIRVSDLQFVRARISNYGAGTITVTAPFPSGIDTASASLANPEAAARFLGNIVKDTDSEYCIIHLLRWAEPKSGSIDQDIQAQNWYLFRRTIRGWSQEDFTARQHIAGGKRVCFAFAHFNRQHEYQPEYTFEIAKKVPSNLGHLFGLINAFASGGSSSQPAAGAGAAVVADEWGSSTINLKYVPSTIAVSATQRSIDPNLALKTDLGKSTFDDEGALYWDISVAVPVRKISEVKFDTSTGAPTPLKVSDQAVFAVVDGYYPGLDPSRSIFRSIPHPLAGVAFSHQPQNKILLGGGWGPSFSELYMGAMWVKQPIGSGGCGKTPAAGETTHNRYCAQFTIGVNLQVSSIVSAIKFH